MRSYVLLALVFGLAAAQDPSACEENQVPAEVECDSSGTINIVECTYMYTESEETVEMIRRETLTQTVEEAEATPEASQCAEGEMLVGIITDGDKTGAICATATNAIVTSVSSTQEKRVTITESTTIVTKENQIIKYMRVEEEEGQKVLVYGVEETVVDEYTDDHTEAVPEDEGCMCMCVDICDYQPAGDSRFKRDVGNLLLGGGESAMLSRDKRQARHFKKTTVTRTSSSRTVSSSSSSRTVTKTSSRSSSSKSIKKTLKVSYVLDIETKGNKQLYIVDPARNIKLCPEDECECGCTCAGA